jgi:DNA-directed RNA polymerase subunit RPC12/RpoP
MAGKFTHINESFTCEHCGKSVPPASTGCRNHCPFCLTSKHVDHYPGDRENECHGLLKATGYELDSKKGLMILFECQRCHAKTRNIANHEDPVCPDNYDQILRLTSSHS